MLPSELLEAATASLLALWLGVAGWIVYARVRSDQAWRRRTDDAARLASGDDASRWRRSRLELVASGHSAPGATVAATELVRRRSRRLLKIARSRSQRRVPALRVLVRGGSPEAFGALRAARRAGSPGLTAAVVALAAESESAAADALLLDVLTDGDHPRSRTATELAPRAARIADELLHLCSHEDPDVRYWALMLLRDVADEPRALAAAVAHATDPAAGVRGAAARLLGSSRSPDVQPAVRSLLSDEMYFVRAHAARAAGEIGAAQLASQVASLLADRNWWVRAAAKESLFRLGPHGLAAASAMLDSDDAFARDGAAEVAAAFRLDHDALELAG